MSTMGTVIFVPPKRKLTISPRMKTIMKALNIRSIVTGRLKLIRSS